MTNFKMILTNAGIAKVVNATMSGKKMDIVQFAVGDATYEPEQSMTALKNLKWRGPVAVVEVEKNNPFWITVTCPIPAEHGGFWIREVGLYDADGDLVAIGRAPDSYKPIVAEGASKDFVIEPIIEVSNSAAVTLKIDPNVIQASRQYVDKKLKEEGEVIIHELAQATDKVVKNVKKSKVSFIIVDDDCRKEAYTWLLPLAESKGFKVTLAHTNNLINGNYMTDKEIADAKKRGHDIQAHSVSHPPLASLATEEEIEYQLRECKERAKRELGLDFEHFIYPHGSYDYRVAQLAAKHYKSAAWGNTDGRILDNTAPISHYALDRFGIGAFGVTSKDKVIAAVDYAIKNNQMCVFTTHVGACSQAELDFIEWVIEYVQSLGYNFVTYKEAFEYHQNSINLGDFDEKTRRNNFCVSYDGKVTRTAKIEEVNDMSINSNNLIANGGLFGYGHPFYKNGIDESKPGVVLDNSVLYKNHPTIKVTVPAQIQLAQRVAGDNGYQTLTLLVKADAPPSVSNIEILARNAAETTWTNLTNLKRRVVSAGNGMYYLIANFETLDDTTNVYVTVGGNFNVCFVTLVRGTNGATEYMPIAEEIKKSMFLQRINYASHRNLLVNGGEYEANKHCFVPSDNSTDGVIIDETITYNSFATLKLISDRQVVTNPIVISHENYYTIAALVKSSDVLSCKTTDIIKAIVTDTASVNWTLFDYVTNNVVTLTGDWQLLNVIIKPKTNTNRLYVSLGAPSQVNVAWVSVVKGTIAPAEYVAATDLSVKSFTLQNGWSAFSGGTGYKLTNDKVVRLSGQVTGGTTNDHTAICTLPIGYRPAANEVIKTPSCDLVVGIDGVIKIYNYVDNPFISGRISLSNISFSAK